MLKTGKRVFNVPAILINDILQMTSPFISAVIIQPAGNLVGNLVVGIRKLQMGYRMALFM